jgi:hypothetical protein
MPEDSLAPFLLTVSMTVLFTSMLLRAWPVAAVAIGLCLVALAKWLWPDPRLAQRVPPSEADVRTAEEA